MFDRLVFSLLPNLQVTNETQISWSINYIRVDRRVGIRLLTGQNTLSDS